MGLTHCSGTGVRNHCRCLIAKPVVDAMPSDLTAPAPGDEGKDRPRCDGAFTWRRPWPRRSLGQVLAEHQLCRVQHAGAESRQRQALEGRGRRFSKVGRDQEICAGVLGGEVWRDGAAAAHAPLQVGADPPNALFKESIRPRDALFLKRTVPALFALVRHALEGSRVPFP